MNSFDFYIQNYISLARSTDVTTFMYLVSLLFDFSTHFILMFLSVAFLINLFKNKKDAFVFIFSIFLTTISVYLLKILFDIGRPIDSVVMAFGQSFPSYHSAISTVFFLMLMYIFDENFKPFWRIIFNTFCLSFIILVSFSRIYLGVHWFSDVLAGVILGFLVSYISIRIFNVKR